MKEIKKQKNKKRKQILRRRIYMMTAGLFVLLAVAFARGHHSAGKEDDLSSKTKEVIQNKTQEEMYTSRLERVKAMAKNQGYPKGVIELLDKNEDTIDFVEDYGEKKDQAAAKDIGVKIQKGTIPELIQWDERWGYTKYGTSIVAVSGCGPTCMSMVVSGLTGNTKITPARTAAYIAVIATIVFPEPTSPCKRRFIAIVSEKSWRISFNTFFCAPVRGYGKFSTNLFTGSSIGII